MVSSDGLDFLPAAASSRSESPVATLYTCQVVRDEAWPGLIPGLKVIDSCRGFRSGLSMIQVVIAIWEIAMASPVPLRSDFDAPRLRALAQAA